MHTASTDMLEDRGAAKVLVVAREARKRAILATLSTLDIVPLAVGSGVEALYAALASSPCPYAAIVLDRDLPGMGPTDTLKALRLAERTRGVPVVLLDTDAPAPPRSPAFTGRTAGPVETVPGHAHARLASKVQTLVELHVLRAERDRMATELRQSYRELAESTAKLEQLVQRDPLTGLVNPAGLEESLHTEQQRARATGAGLFALFVDLDRFDSLNRRLGQSGGDRVLREVATTLRQHTRAFDVAARVGSDEFLILLTAGGTEDVDLAAARSTASTLSEALACVPAVPDAVERETITATIAVLRLDTRMRLDEVLRTAREAIAVTRLGGRNRWAVVGEAPDARVFGRMSSDIETGAIQTETRAAAHAIVRVHDERIIGCELLIRGAVGPLSLPRDFEQVYANGDPRILHFVDRHCLHTCTAAVHALARHDVQVNLNLFPSTLLALGPDPIADHLLDASTEVSWCVELSEHLFVEDPVALASAVERLRIRGIRIAVDDVGFGNSSLEGILRLAPDVLKIDRRFVTGVREDATPARRDALRRIVALAGALGADLIAEGVEKRSDLAVLADLGVGAAQGWLWGRPGDPAKVLDGPQPID
jgi:diguanylate cyclase (GGDEF)-like protein